MSELTIKFAEDTARSIQNYQSGIVDSDEELAKAYLQVYKLEKQVQSAKESMKDSLIERGIDDQIFPEEERKVVLEEGNKKTNFDNYFILLNAKTQGLLKELAECISINQTKAKELGGNKITGIIEDYRSVEGGNMTIKVKKMTKKELSEIA